MNWTKDKSVKLSLVCVWIFAVLLLITDIFVPKIASELLGCFVSFFNMKTLFIFLLYLGSVFGWICLWNLRALLKNLQNGEVFTADNIAIMRRVSWCCAWAAIVSLALSLYSLIFFVLAVASAFMMVVVRVVKNAFQQAMEMKSELDLTI